MQVLASYIIDNKKSSCC